MSYFKEYREQLSKQYDEKTLNQNLKKHQGYLDIDSIIMHGPSSYKFFHDNKLEINTVLSNNSKVKIVNEKPSQIQKDYFLDIAFHHAQVARNYVEAYIETINPQLRMQLFDVMLENTGVAASFMKKKKNGGYTEYERKNFALPLYKRPRVFLNHMKHLPDLLKDGVEKQIFYNQNREKLIKDIFRSDFKSLYSIFKEQLVEKEIIYIAEHLLRRQKDKAAIDELLKVIENKRINVDQQLVDKLTSDFVMSSLTNEI